MEKSFFGYMVDSDGFIWNKKHTKHLIGQPNNCGYLRVAIRFKGKTHFILVHRIVAILFCDKPDGCDIVNHKDSNRTNNNYMNLEWVSYQQNSKHAYEKGRLDDSLKKARDANPNYKKKGNR